MLRCRTPEQTLRILEELSSKYYITRLAELSGLDDCSSLKVYSAIRPLAKSLSVSMGKSLDEESAKCSALAESIETHLAEEVKPQVMNASYSTIRQAYKKKLIKPSEMSTFRGDVGEQYPHHWNIGYEYETEEEVYIPYVCLSLNTNDLLNSLLGSSSRGIATGNTIYEAIVKGTFEVIEWEALHDGEKKPLFVQEHLLTRYGINADYICDFFEYKNDYGVPVVSVELYHNSNYLNQCVYRGSVASETYESAIFGALEEAIQTKVGVISGARDDLKMKYYQTDNSFKRRHHIPEPPSYKDMTSWYPKDILKELNQRISSLNKKLIIFEYHMDSITVVKTFITNCENYIL